MSQSNGAGQAPALVLPLSAVVPAYLQSLQQGFGLSLEPDGRITAEVSSGAWTLIELNTAGGERAYAMMLVMAAPPALVIPGATLLAGSGESARPARIPVTEAGMRIRFSVDPTALPEGNLRALFPGDVAASSTPS